MRTAAQWWNETADDEAWITDQASLIEQIQREAFAAGYREGAETTARGIDGHAAKLGSQIAVRIPESVPRGMVALAGVARELGADAVAIEAAWRRSGASGPRADAKRSA